MCHIFIAKIWYWFNIKDLSNKVEFQFQFKIIYPNLYNIIVMCFVLHNYV